MIKTICENANLKYSYENNILKIERDFLYLEDYDLDILQDSELWSTLEDSVKNILLIEQNKINHYECSAVHHNIGKTTEPGGDISIKYITFPLFRRQTFGMRGHFKHSFCC